MLQSIRKRQKTLLAVFITLISIVFVFWGFYGGFTPLGDQEVASVNGDGITVQEFQRHYKNTVRLYQNILKDKFTPEMAERFNLNRVTLNQLIDQRLILQGAKSLGLKVTDQEIRDQIVKVPAFLRGNTFDPNLYKSILRANRLTPASFEENIRLEILQQKITSLLRDHLKSSPQEVLEDYKLANDKADVEFIKIDPAIFKTDMIPPASDLAAFSAKEDNIKRAHDHYSKNIHIYKQHHEVKAKHILIKVDAKAKKAKREDARMRMEKIRKEALTGDFAALAKKYSEDVASAKQGGNLGYFGKGRMVKAFEDAAFGLKAGELSNIVKTPYGYHLIKAEDVRPEKQKTFDEVKESIFRTFYVDDKASVLAKESIDKLWNLRTKRLQFNKALKKHKLKWESTGLFSRGTRFIPKIGEADAIQRTAFQLTKKRQMANRYFQIRDLYYIIRLKKRTQPNMKAFKKEEKKLTQQALSERQSNAYYEWLKKLKDGAKIKVRKTVLEQQQF